MSPIPVIAGRARGRSIDAPPTLATRPILARIKKSVFDIITARLPDCSFLDLYAGVGSVGIEAISRGASKAVFVESDKLPLSYIKRNLEKLGFTSNAVLVQYDVFVALKLITEQFDIVYLGPPYKDENKKPLALTTPTLNAVVAANVLKPTGVLISQRQIKEVVTVPKELMHLREKIYGDTVVDFYELVADKTTKEQE